MRTSAAPARRGVESRQLWTTASQRHQRRCPTGYERKRPAAHDHWRQRHGLGARPAPATPMAGRVLGCHRPSPGSRRPRPVRPEARRRLQRAELRKRDGWPASCGPCGARKTSTDGFRSLCRHGGSWISSAAVVPKHTSKRASQPRSSKPCCRSQALLRWRWWPYPKRLRRARS